MPYQVSATIGFVTNSSSAIMLFPPELLKHPEVKAFLEAFEIGEGFVGADLWHRGRCGTIAISPAQKRLAKTQLKPDVVDEDTYTDSRVPDFDPESDEVLVIFGDEYNTAASEIGRFLRRVAEEAGIPYSSNEYN